MFQLSSFIGADQAAPQLNLPSLNQEAVRHILLGDYGAIAGTIHRSGPVKSRFLGLRFCRWRLLAPETGNEGWRERVLGVISPGASALGPNESAAAR